MELKGKPLNSTSVILSWTPTLLPHVRHYHLIYQLLADDSHRGHRNKNVNAVRDGTKSINNNNLQTTTFKTIRLPLKTTSFVLSGLQKWAMYRVFVESVLSDDSSVAERSNHIDVRTDEDVPSEPRSMKIDDVTDTSVRISWLPPRNANGVIRGYYVYIVRIDDDDDGNDGGGGGRNKGDEYNDDDNDEYDDEEDEEDVDYEARLSSRDSQRKSSNGHKIGDNNNNNNNNNKSNTNRNNKNIRGRNRRHSSLHEKLHQRGNWSRHFGGNIVFNDNVFIDTNPIHQMSNNINNIYNINHNNHHHNSHNNNNYYYNHIDHKNHNNDNFNILTYDINNDGTTHKSNGRFRRLMENVNNNNNNNINNNNNRINKLHNNRNKNHNNIDSNVKNMKYNIFVTKEDDHITKVDVRNDTTTSVVIHELSPSSKYSVRMLAYTIKGDGADTKPKTFKTLTDKCALVNLMSFIFVSFVDDDSVDEDDDVSDENDAMTTDSTELMLGMQPGRAIIKRTTAKGQERQQRRQQPVEDEELYFYDDTFMMAIFRVNAK
ncbi:hypothetical protein HELRODRAFT_166066 [Helobdella robusta]|uniref:Fibronectin type-III domain-containing protein n=1 Tax=Helobdella robusta TaxID=6412 RepID=T1EXP3_HELRO|nr:hypothetical protein HELRODRAFT_166066 [Helobdella robusta]ESN90401.1 hypothetical protein HELRODRAFT_166066 [Helobdella robusta]